MYKAFGKRLGWMATGSICTIIGLVFANVFSEIEAQDQLGSFDIVTCEKLLITDKNGRAIAYLGSADGFESQGMMDDSDKALLAFLDTTENTQQAVWLTNSCLSFRNDKGKILQIGQPVLVENASGMFGMMIYDSVSTVLSVMLGADKATGVGFLSLGRKGEVTLYPREETIYSQPSTK